MSEVEVDTVWLLKLELIVAVKPNRDEQRAQGYPPSLLLLLQQEETLVECPVDQPERVKDPKPLLLLEHLDVVLDEHELGLAIVVPVVEAFHHLVVTLFLDFMMLRLGKHRGSAAPTRPALEVLVDLGEARVLILVLGDGVPLLALGLVGQDGVLIVVLEQLSHILRC